MMKYTLLNTINLILLLTGMALGQMWRTVTPLNTPRAGASAVVYNGYIYLFGGKSSNNTILNSVERFDPHTGSWDTTAVPPFDHRRFNAAAVVYNGKFFLIGGKDDQEVLDDVEIYDPLTNEWTDGEELLNARERHAAAVIGGKLYVVGGIKENSYIEEIEWYNFNQAQWEQSSWKMIRPRAGYFSTVVADTFYMFGGVYINPLFENYKYGIDFQWRPIANLSISRWYGATAVLGDSIFLIGGVTLKASQPMNTPDVKIYNIRSNIFEDGPALPEPISGATAVTLEDKIYLIGGFNTRNQPLASVYTLNKTFTAIEDKAVAPPVIKDFAILKGYPNPFNGQLTLQITLSRRFTAQLQIYDLNGRLVRDLFSGTLSAGQHQFRWDALNNWNMPVASGLYLAILKTPEGIKSLKIIYAK